MSDYTLANVSGEAFLKPEDDRPSHGPVYVVNLTSSTVKLAASDGVPALTLGCFGTPQSIQQTSLKALDMVPFMGLWASGKVAVSTDSRIVSKYAQMEQERVRAEDDRLRQLSEMIEVRDDSSDIIVTQDALGRPTYVRKGNL